MGSDIAQAITGITSALVEFLKGRDSSYARKLDKDEKKKLEIATQVLLRCIELNIDDKSIRKLSDKFFRI